MAVYLGWFARRITIRAAADAGQRGIFSLFFKELPLPVGEASQRCGGWHEDGGAYGGVSMFDSLPGETGLFHFDDIANLLLEQGESCSPSELHGCLCGLLAAGDQAGPEAGLDGLNQAMNLDLHGELAEQVLGLYEVSLAAMEDDAFDFMPLLPDDSVELEQRLLALSDWCRGFLAGYARATVRAGSGGETLPGDSTEVLRDFAAIIQVGQDAEDVDEDESEQHYYEVVEYLRFAALNVYMDSRGRQEERQRAADRRPGALH